MTMTKEQALAIIAPGFANAFGVAEFQVETLLHRLGIAMGGGGGDEAAAPALDEADLEAKIKAAVDQATAGLQAEIDRLSDGNGAVSDLRAEIDNIKTRLDTLSTGEGADSSAVTDLSGRVGKLEESHDKLSSSFKALAEDQPTTGATGATGAADTSGSTLGSTATGGTLGTEQPASSSAQ